MSVGKTVKRRGTALPPERSRPSVARLAADARELTVAIGFARRREGKVLNGLTDEQLTAELVS